MRCCTAMTAHAAVAASTAQRAAVVRGLTRRRSQASATRYRAAAPTSTQSEGHPCDLRYSKVSVEGDSKYASTRESTWFSRHPRCPAE